MHRLAVFALVVGCGSGTRANDPIIPPTPTDKPPVVVTPEAPPKTPPIAIAATPPAAGDIGTANAGWVMAASTAGDVVLVCQARVDTDKNGKLETTGGHHGEIFGDELAPFLVRGAGAGEALDDVVAVDAAVKHVVVAKGKTLELVELAVGGKRVALTGADTKYEDAVFGGARAAFDRSGEHVFYVRAGAKRTIVMRTLASGEEREIDPGKGTLRSAEIVDGWLVAYVYDPTPGSTILIGSQSSGPAHTVGGRRCRGDVARGARDNTRVRWASLGGTGAIVAKERREVVTNAGEALVVRAADGALAIEQAGTATPLTPAACTGKVIARSAAPPAVLVACASSGLKATLTLWTNGAAKQLPTKIDNPVANEGYASDLERAEHELGEGGASRLARIPVDGASLLLDLASGNSRKLDSHYPIAAYETKVLLHAREGSFVVYDLERGTWTELPGKPPDMMDETQRGRLFAAGPFRDAEGQGVLVDLEAAVKLGNFVGSALAVSSTGWILTPAKPPAGVSQVGHFGPYHWVRPTR